METKTIYTVFKSFRDADNAYSWNELNDSCNPTYSEVLKSFDDLEKAKVFFDTLNCNDEGEGEVEYTLFESSSDCDLDDAKKSVGYEDDEDIHEEDGSIFDNVIEYISKSDLLYNDIDSKIFEERGKEISPNAVIAVWSWEKYVGYARNLHTIEYAKDMGIEDEAELSTGNKDMTFSKNLSVIIDDAEGMSEEKLYEAIMEELGNYEWKWNNNYDIIVSDFINER